MKKLPSKRLRPNSPTGPKRRKSSNRPDLKKLFRLLAKVERDQLFDQIKAELDSSGNNLSDVVDGEYPLGNFTDPKLLRLLLGAGLSPETLDEKGQSLLIQAAGNPKCLELLLKAGVSVNRVCNGYIATALMRAAMLGKRASTELLLEYGADASITNRAGKTALQLVDKRSRDRKVIENLLRTSTIQ